MNRLKALVRKEFFQIFRDPSAILIAFVLPLLLLFIFGYGVNLDSNQIKIGLVLESVSPEVESLAAAFKNSRFMDTHIGKDRREFEAELVAGRIRGIVVVPQNFSIDLNAGDESAKIQVLADGAEPNLASFVHNYVQGVYSVWLQHQMEDRGLGSLELPIDMTERFWYNAELKSRNFLLPGSIAIIMTLIGTLLTALVVAREWERGTMEALMATPVNIIEIMLGKMIPYYLLAVCSMAVCWAVAVFWYDVPFRGSFLALLLATSVFLLAALGQGLLISSVARDQYIASQIAILSAFLPAFMLSGFIFEISSMPTPIRGITVVLAVRYFVSCLQTLFLVGDVWPLLLSCFAAMGCIGLVFFLLISRKTVKRLE